MELFLLCSDDAESDVRMVADECLNKVIKVRMGVGDGGWGWAQLGATQLQEAGPLAWLPRL